MRCVLLRGACLQHARQVGHFDGFLVDIKVAASSHAINLSEALKRPEHSFGGTTDSKASSFTAGSTRVYISVVCVFAGPSHSLPIQSAVSPFLSGAWLRIAVSIFPAAIMRSRLTAWV